VSKELDFSLILFLAWQSCTCPALAHSPIFQVWHACFEMIPLFRPAPFHTELIQVCPSFFVLLSCMARSLFMDSVRRFSFFLSFSHMIDPQVFFLN